MFRTTFVSLALTASLPAATRVFQIFEGDGFNDWKVEGEAFGLAPVAGRTDGMKNPFVAYANDSLAASNHGGDAAKGTLTSPDFSLREPYITFLVAGGNTTGKTAVQLLIDGEVAMESTGKRSLILAPVVWDVARFKGRNAKIRLIDDADGEWGMIAADHLVFTDYPNQKFPATTRGGKPFVDGLVETPAFPGVNIPIGSALSIVADHDGQQVTSPTALTFDEQGRIYISETHRFREGVEDDRDNLFWYLDDLASKTTADRRAMHEKWKDKVPLEKMTAKSEVIRRLTDTDGDGKIDEETVFADGFNDVLDGTAAGVFYYEGSLYFACIPKIYMLRDNDGDGKSDDRKVVEEGFGVRVSLSGHDLNGFTLGPDGRIYGTVGDRGLSFITKEGVSYEYPNEGAAFRFEPDGTGFELFHTGLRNPKEIAFDALGNAFTVDNNSDQGDAARIVYLVEGGDSGWQMEHQAMHSFHRQIGLKDHPPSRWMDERMWEMENPSQPAYILPPNALLTAGPSGLTYHPGAGFLQSETNHFLICDYRGGSANSGIWSFEMKPRGAGMAMTDSRQFMWGVAATDVEYSWDGKLYVTDFEGGWKSHEKGRVLSLDAGDKTWQAVEVAGAARIMKAGIEQRSSAELAVLLKHPDMRIRLRAQIALTRKPDSATRFTEAVQSANYQTRIHGIWGLGIVARRGASPLPNSEFGELPIRKNVMAAEKELIGLLKDKDPEIRAQALRCLAETKSQGMEIPLGPLLVDESPRVRFFAAIAAGKRRMIGYYGPVCEMIRENDNHDVYLRHAGSFALQQMAEKPIILTSLVNDESAAVRLAATVALRRLKNPGVATFLFDLDPKVADEAIRAVCDLDMVSQRPQVAALLDHLGNREWSSFMLRRLIHNSYRLGTAEDARRVVKIAADPKMPEIVRQEAFRLLSTWTDPSPVDQLTGHWSPLEKRESSTVIPALVEVAPFLLTFRDFALTATLQLAKQYQLSGLGLDSESMLQRVKDTALPDDARTAALDLLVLRQPADLDQVLAGVAADPSDDLALASLAIIAGNTPAKALPLLESAVKSTSVPRIQKAWDILATIPGEEADALFVKNLDELRTANGISPAALELTAAASKRKSVPVTTALGALEKSLAESSDPLAKWNSALEGGDPKSGEAIFASHPASECMRCHRAEDGHSAGGETAPNLAGIANRHPDSRYLLESMIRPSAVIAPGFGTVLIKFKNGTSIGGNVIAESTDHLDLDASGKAVRVRRSDIQSVTAPVSPMPPMENVLKTGELRDLVAWLASLHEGGETPVAAAVPTLLDPASLVEAEKPAVPAANTPNTPDPAAMTLGKQQFITCSGCHGQNGEGTAAAPPLAGSEWVLGPEENLIRIQLRGLVGPIEVKGVTHNMDGGMVALAYQTDKQIAAVLTYVRNSFGNSAPPVAAAAVAALRSEIGKPQLTAADLLPPIPSGPAAAIQSPAAGETNKYADLSVESSATKWIILAAGLIFVSGIVAFNLRKSAD